MGRLKLETFLCSPHAERVLPKCAFRAGEIPPADARVAQKAEQRCFTSHELGHSAIAGKRCRLLMSRICVFFWWRTRVFPPR